MLLKCHFDLEYREEKNERSPTNIKKQHTKSIGFVFSIQIPVKNAANEDISVIIAEPKPEALPARCGIAFTISAFDAGQIIPDPKVMMSMGRKVILEGKKRLQRPEKDLNDQGSHKKA